jgi:hypothetical protein
MPKVITYSSARECISVTPAQERMLREAGKWPKDRIGDEMVNVDFGLHSGNPTHTDDELRKRCGIA